MARLKALIIFSFFVLFLSCVGKCRDVNARVGPPLIPYRTKGSLFQDSVQKELITRCKVYSRSATLDHFSWVMIRTVNMKKTSFIMLVAYFQGIDRSGLYLRDQDCWVKR